MKLLKKWRIPWEEAKMGQVIEVFTYLINYTMFDPTKF